MRTIHSTPAPVGFVLGPAPCRDCRVPLYWTPAEGWRERTRILDPRAPGRRLRVPTRDGRRLLLPIGPRVATFFVRHVCGAAGPIPVAELRRLSGRDVKRARRELAS